MTLTLAERLILANQFRILAKLNARDGADYKAKIEILEGGYAHEYSSLVSGFSKDLSAETSQEVLDILDMFRALSYGYKLLKTKKGIAAKDIAFGGFDGNNEVEHFSYACLLINRLKYFEESKNAGDKLNSHHHTLDRYLPMVERWKACADPHLPTREEILHIIER